MGIPCRKGSELGIGRLAMGHPANTQVELTTAVCVLGFRKVCMIVLGSYWKGKHGFQDKRKKDQGYTACNMEMRLMGREVGGEGEKQTRSQNLEESKREREKRISRRWADLNMKEAVLEESFKLPLSL